MLVIPNSILDSLKYIFTNHSDCYDLFKYLVEKWFDIDSNFQFIDSEVSEKLHLEKEAAKNQLLKLSKILPFLKIHRWKNDFVIVFLEQRNTKAILRNTSGMIFALHKIYDIIKNISKELNLNCIIDASFLGSQEENRGSRGKGETKADHKIYFSKRALQKSYNQIHKLESISSESKLLEKSIIETSKPTVINIVDLYKKFEGVEEQFIPLTQSESNAEEKIPIRRETWKSKCLPIWNSLDFVEYFKSMCLLITGNRYIPAYGKDPTLFKRLLTELTKKELKRCIDWYLHNYLKLFPFKGKPEIRLFSTNINTILGSYKETNKRVGEFDQTKVKQDQGILSAWE